MSTNLKMPPAEETKQVFPLPKLWIGKIVLYYPHADWSSVPAPAVVQKFDQRGGCTLGVISENTLSVKAVHGARYMHDPSIETWHEDAKRACGGWDLVEPEREALASVNAKYKGLPPLKAA